MHGVDAVADRDALFDEDGGLAVRSAAAGEDGVPNRGARVAGDDGVEAERWEKVSTIIQEREKEGRDDEAYIR